MAQPVRFIEPLPLPIVPRNLKIGREIDGGAWGAVHEGEFDGKLVAVKKVHKLLKDSEDGGYAVRSFCQECERLMTIQHDHVVGFRGAFKDAELGPILVMERMNENLRRFLERQQDKLTPQEQIRISHEITQGVAFLHQQTPPMVHRDLNDKNVMFTINGVAKIGDFGQSKLKTEFYLKTTAPGMVSFMPPEALRHGYAKYDESLDVFSLGVVMLSIGTQHPPSSDITGICVIPEVERRAKDLEKMSDTHPLKPLILHCLHDDPRQRPKAAELVIVLPRLKENMLQTIIYAEKRYRQLETSRQQSEEQVRLAEVENQELQRQVATKQQHAQRYKADLHVALEQLEKMQMKLDHADSLEKARATEKRAKDEFIAQMRYQLEIYEGRSNGVQHLGQSKEPSDAQRHSTMRQKAGGVPLTQPIMWHNEETVGRRDAPSSSSPHQDVLQVNQVPKEGRAYPVADQQKPDKQIANAVVMQEERALATPRGRLIVTPETLTDTRADTPALTRPDASTVTRPHASTGTRPDASTVTRPHASTFTRPDASTGTRPDASTVIRPDAPTLGTPEVMKVAKNGALTVPMGNAPATYSSTKEQHPSDVKAFPSKGENDPSESVPLQPNSESNHSPEKESDGHDTKPAPSVVTSEVLSVAKSEARTIPEKTIATPKDATSTPDASTVARPEEPAQLDVNMHDAPSCEKCGKSFLWNQRLLSWKHECTRVAESGECVPKPAPSVAMKKTVPPSTLPRGRSSTTNRRSESDTQAAATDEDAPKCEKCGRTFPWNQLQLRWKHKCEPTEVARAPDTQRRRAQSSASSLRRPVSVANEEQLYASSTVKHGVRNDSVAKGVSHVCRCGMTFADNQVKEFMIHVLQCPKGAPKYPPSAEKQSTLQRK